LIAAHVFIVGTNRPICASSSNRFFEITDGQVAAMASSETLLIGGQVSVINIVFCTRDWLRQIITNNSLAFLNLEPINVVLIASWAVSIQVSRLIQEIVLSGSFYDCAGNDDRRRIFRRIGHQKI
jgi:hypothetical protein